MKIISRIVEVVGVLILIFLTGLVFIQVIMRNVFETGFVWSQEMSRFLLLSGVLISAPLVFFHGEHVRFDMLVRKAPPLVQKIQGLLGVLLAMFFYAVYIVSHLDLMKGSAHVVSPSLRIPNSIFFGAGLVGAALGGLFGIAKLIAGIRNLKE